MATHFFFYRTVFSERGEGRTWRLRIIEYSFSLSRGRSISLSSPPWTLTQIYDGGIIERVWISRPSTFSCKMALRLAVVDPGTDLISILAATAGQIQFSNRVYGNKFYFIYCTGSWRYIFLYTTRILASSLVLTQHVQLF